mgnify:CR=1 FL=1
MNVVTPIPAEDRLPGDRAGSHPDIVLADTIRASKILIVDDQKPIRELLKLFLAAGSYTNLVFAEDGDEALEAIAAERPDLVILDLQMPRVGGLDVCAAVRADPAQAGLPVLVQTAADSPEDRAKIFAAGATDMVGKPINSAELLARVGIHLQNRHMLRQLSVYRESMERELETARRMQHDIMPHADVVERLEQRYGIRIESHFQTCDALGGDFWNVWPLDDRRLGFGIVDFTGHGVVASLNTFRFQSLTLSPDLRELGFSAYVERLNRHLKRMLPVGQFATAIAGYVDFERDVIRYCAAGGPSPFLRIPGESDGRFCSAAGRPLGMAADSQYPEIEIPFPPGSSCFLFSDALTETPNIADPVCDEDRIRAVLTAPPAVLAGRSPFEALVADFSGRLSGPLNDDLTLLMLTRNCGGDAR